MDRRELDRALKSDLEGELRSPGSRPSRPRRRLRVDAGGKVLPFLDVLIRGREPHLSESDLVHPSVGYAQGIYVVIAFGWVIEVASFAYLGWTYSAGLDSLILRGIIAALAGFSFATTVLFLELLFVRKPLPIPRVTLVSQIAFPAVIGLLTAGLAIQFDLGGAWSMVVGALAAGVFGVVGSMWGWMQSALIMSRVAIVALVALIVAIPLHEMMFITEIKDAYYTPKIESIRDEISAINKEIRSACETQLNSARMHLEKDQACKSEQDKVEHDNLACQAYTFVLDTTRKSYNQKSKTELRFERSQRKLFQEAAHKIGGDDIMSFVTQSPSQHRREKSLIDDTKRKYCEVEVQNADKELKKCRYNVDNIERNVEQCVAKSSGEGDRADTLIQKRGELDGYLNDKATIGALDLGLALDKVERGDIKLAPEDLARARRAVIFQKFITPWFLALLIPMIVIALKLTAGKELEDYLYQRWGYAEYAEHVKQSESTRNGESK